MKSQKKKPSAKSTTKPAPVVKKGTKPAPVGKLPSKELLEAYENALELALQMRTVEWQKKIEAEDDQVEKYGAPVPVTLMLGPETYYDKFPAIKFGNYAESAASAEKAEGKVPKAFQAHLPLDPFQEQSLLDKAFPPHPLFTRLYYDEDGKWLLGCKRNIFKAVANGDEAFFLRLARVIEERPKLRAYSPLAAKTYGRPTDPKPGTQTDLVRCLLVFNWVLRPLWLMSSTVACDYIRKFISLEITPESYNKIKHELGLKQHPKVPVVGFTDNGEVVLKAGWKFPKS